MIKQTPRHSHYAMLLSNAKEWTIYNNWIDIKALCLMEKSHSQKVMYSVIPFE